MILNRCKENHRYLFAILIFWIVMVASRIGLLRLFPAGGNTGDLSVSIVWILIVIASFLAVLLLGDSLPKNFLLITLFIGVFYTLITLFAYCTDEEFHFMRAFGITNGEFMPPFVDSKAGIHLPNGYDTFAQREAWSLISFSQNSNLISPVRELFFFARDRSADYLPLCYLPSAVGLGLGRLLGAPLVIDILLGRLTNYVAYVLVCYIAIKRSKHFQTVLFLTALIPTSLELAGTFTIDSSLISFSLLFLSICLHYSFDETAGEVKKRDLILLAISALVLLSVKYLGYFAILGLVFFLPKQRVSNKRTVVTLLLIVFTLVAILQVWAITAYQGSFDGSTQAGADVRGQVSFILSHPASYIKMLAINFLPNFVERMHFFIETGSMSLNFLAEPLALLPIFGALLAKDKPALTSRQKTGWSLLCIAIFCATTLLSITALYLSFTPVGATSVQGMQNRYVLPVVALVYIVISFIPVENRIARWERSLSFLSALAILNILAGKLIELMMI